MVRLTTSVLFLHLSPPGREDGVLLRCVMFDWFRLGATEVVRAPAAVKVRRYHSTFPEAASAVAVALSGRRSCYWKEYMVYVRCDLPQPFTSAPGCGTLQCDFCLDGQSMLATHASPSLAALEVTSLSSDDGSGEWVEAGLLRPFVPRGTAPAIVARRVADDISKRKHHMSHSNAGSAHSSSGSTSAASSSSASAASTADGRLPVRPGGRVRFRVGGLVFVDWHRRGTGAPAPRHNLPWQVAAAEYVRMPAGRTERRTERSPLDVTLTPWGAARREEDSIVVPRGCLVKFEGGFATAWHAARPEQRELLMRALEYEVQLKRHHRPGSCPGVEKIWASMMGDEPLPPPAPGTEPPT